MTCTIVLTVITCSGVGQRPSPEAAVLHMTSPYVYVPTRERDPLPGAPVKYDPTWPFTSVVRLPDRRLDGSLMSEPPVVYGPYGVHGGYNLYYPLPPYRPAGREGISRIVIVSEGRDRLPAQARPLPPQHQNRFEPVGVKLR